MKSKPRWPVGPNLYDDLLHIPPSSYLAMIEIETRTLASCPKSEIEPPYSTAGLCSLHFSRDREGKGIESRI